MRRSVSSLLKEEAGRMLSAFRIEGEDMPATDALVVEVPGDGSNPADAAPFVGARDRLEEYPAVFPLTEEQQESEYSPNNGGGVLLNDPGSMKDKQFKSAPTAKPKRRSLINESETRGYRNEYQEKYREEHGNGYIKKGPKR